MRYVVKGKRFLRRGTVSLFFNGELVTSQRFSTPTYRKEVIASWKKKYQFERVAEHIYLQVDYDQTY